MTHSFCRTAAVDLVSELREVETHSWLEKRGQVTSLYEQVVAQENGWATTLLIVDEDEVDDEEDDRHWNRSNRQH
ncbi:MAG: hypothetical protein KGL29_12780 [Alphaproteobacteria bacterium]|nr:hypothetical protein [Alphaproteobacteria bacterium]